MKILRLFLGIFLIVSFSFATSESKCWAHPCADAIQFLLIDKATQQDLVFGPNPRYEVDSMQLNRSTDYNLGYHANFLSRVFKIGYNLATSTSNRAIDTCYLRLTSNDIDTLTIKYVFDKDDCCSNYGGFGKIVSINYNGQTAMKNGENYKFEKQ